MATSKYTTTTVGSSSGAQSNSLEPRVAKLETGLEILTKDVSTLAQIVRDQGTNIERELHQLGVQVSQAAGPRKTEWGLVINFTLLIMAIASAMFWPLNQTAQNTKNELKDTVKAFDDHQKLDNHPVTKVLLNRLEDQLATHIINNDSAMRLHQDWANQQFSSLDSKLQKEYTLVNARLETQIASLDTKVQLEMKLLGETVNNRLKELEHITDRQDTMDLQELRAWRNKASGLSSASSFVPLATQQEPIAPKP
jgi:hypothetical protein